VIFAGCLLIYKDLQIYSIVENIAFRNLQKNITRFRNNHNMDTDSVLLFNAT